MKNAFGDFTWRLQQGCHTIHILLYAVHSPPKAFELQKMSEIFVWNLNSSRGLRMMRVDCEFSFSISREEPKSEQMSNELGRFR
jgi:hypothetical protein